MATVTELTTIEDNTKFRVYGPNTTTTRISPWTSRQMDTRYYRGTYWDALNPGSFRFYFEGTSVAFFGIVPSSPLQRPGVIIDDYSVIDMEAFDDPTGSTYRQWFQSPTLADGFHAISVENCTNGTALDFAAIKVGTRNYNLTQSTIVVDNESPSILYTGHWSRNTSVITLGTTFRAYPYGNSTHRSSTPGDTFTFRFTGTSISLYGTFLLSNVGALGATYTLDGAAVPQIRNITSSTSEPQEAANFLHYSLDNLPPGDHTLIVNVTVANNHTFVLDYITYKPSFEMLLTMPFLDNTTPPTTPGSINSSTPLGSPTSQPSQIRPSPTAAILGGVVGALAIVLLAILGRWLFLRRKKTKQTEDASPFYTYEYRHQPDNDTSDQGWQHLPQPLPLPLRSDSQGPQPMKFMAQTADSHVRLLLDQPPDIDIRPMVTDTRQESRYYSTP